MWSLRILPRFPTGTRARAARGVRRRRRTSPGKPSGWTRVDARIDPDSRSRPRRIGDWLRRARAEIRADRARANGDVGADASVDDGALARPPPPGADTRAGAGRDARSIAHARRARASVAPRPIAPRLAAARRERRARARGCGGYPTPVARAALFRCRSRPPRRSGRASRPAPSLAPRVAPALRARSAPPPPRPAPPRRARRPRGSLDGAPPSSSPRRGARDDDDDADARGAGGGGAARAERASRRPRRGGREREPARGVRGGGPRGHRRALARAGDGAAAPATAADDVAAAEKATRLFPRRRRRRRRARPPLPPSAPLPSEVSTGGEGGGGGGSERRPGRSERRWGFSLHRGVRRGIGGRVGLRPRRAAGRSPRARRRPGG